MIEKVNPSHPDKVADRIAGAIVDLAYKKNERPQIAVEVLIGHGLCTIIIESSIDFEKEDNLKEIEKIVRRITGEALTIHVVSVKQDSHLSNNQSEEYAKNNTTSLSEKESIILDEVNKVVRGYTLEDLNAEGGVEKMNKEMLKKLQNIFGADYIVGISFPDFKTE